MDIPASDLVVLNPAEARILGCLAEKKELTPDVYPLTLNSALAAANQKTARDPVMALEQAEVHRALTTLEQKGLVRQVFASRVERYEQLLSQRYSLTRGQTAIIALLLLRGAQTAHELLARSERMAAYHSIEDLNGDLDLLIGRKTPLVQLVERGPGQREDRYVHLLSGPVAAVAPMANRQTQAFAPVSGIEARIEALEAQVAALSATVEALARKG
ncbi:MAG: DUF480 domain-containing protein [Mesorhizobium sp.]|nr:DUF480 domain-containing protein [Mesorhizobium sp.]